MESRPGAGAHLARACPAPFLPQPRAAAGTRAGRLDSRGPFAGAVPDSAAQVSVGQRAREVGVSSTPSRAVVLLSGGLDSATALAIACAQGYASYALSVDYGQRHAAELA